MYYGREKRSQMIPMRGLGFGVSAKVKVPAEIKAAAAELPAFRQEMGRVNNFLDKVQVYAPYVILGSAALVAFVVLMRSEK